MYNPRAQMYCSEDISNIENFDKAQQDPERVWPCHHRDEIRLNLSHKELKKRGLYYSRPAKDLIFLPPDEHRSLHMKGCHINVKRDNANYKVICPIKLAYLYTTLRLPIQEIMEAVGIKSRGTLIKKRKEFGIKDMERIPWNKNKNKL